MRARRLCKLPMPHPPSFSPTPPAHSAADDPVAEASCVAGSGAPPRQESKTRRSRMTRGKAQFCEYEGRALRYCSDDADFECV